MKTLKRNKQAFWYALYDGKQAVKDTDGNETGEYKIVYKTAEKTEGNISAATGSSQVEQFGNFAGYDRVIVTEDVNSPIDENTVLFVDISPTYDTENQPLYDYVVKRVAKSLNSVSYAITKVTVS